MGNEYIDNILSNFNFSKIELLPILTEIQKQNKDNYISDDISDYVAVKLKMPKARVDEVITFFSAINTSKKGKFVLQLCESTVCGVKKKHLMGEAIEKKLNIKLGETTPDNLFTFEHTPCFGACDIAPAMRVNGVVHGNLTVDKITDLIDQLSKDGGNNK
ncbi:complex I 24 kDa subunit family protein [Psychrilyobacter atlanticus]|uniref:complex I 24 kDa subunit family protein n=1 Tax=Psychrilyobacter atlanticus TaxID=271091 RepID=UPI00041BD046|nr:NAD(P)H-dependent oxidoreductase subunit E [Psychrilyobacter atlanticus]